MICNISRRTAGPLVLIAEDLSEIANDWVRTLSFFGIQHVWAQSLKELDDYFLLFENELDAIILDGCIPGNTVNTLEFVRRARSQGFAKPIIASSSLQAYRDMMVRAGCSHEAPKRDAAEFLVELLTAP